MKSMSQVVKASDAVETLEEARAMIDSQRKEYRQLYNKHRDMKTALLVFVQHASPVHTPLTQKLWDDVEQILPEGCFIKPLPLGGGYDYTSADRTNT